MKSGFEIIEYSPEYQKSIRKILTKIGWTEQYVSSAEQNMHNLSQDKGRFGVYLAVAEGEVVGFLYIEFYAWNQLSQIQGLAVDPDFHRQGIASALVVRAEEFARSNHARGVYVDTPTKNTRGRKFYEAVGYQLSYFMLRYYEDELDGVIYQKFFTSLPSSTTL
jgi:ribosomal protein S18 acetylase RimI-like enzyme